MADDGKCEACKTGQCTPTLRRPLVWKKDSRTIWASPVASHEEILLSLNGTLNGKTVKCKMIATKKSTGHGTVTMKVPKGVRGEVYVHCPHCNITSGAKEVDTTA